MVMDLYTLFIENVFGGFWLAVIGLAAVFFLMLAMGGVSAYSIGIFVMVFALAMAIGYGNSIITVPIVIFILSWSILQIKRHYEEV